MCFRRKLDATEALVEVAREAGLDVQRFRIDLGSNAIVEAFGADLEETRTIRRGARRRVTEGPGRRAPGVSGGAVRGRRRRAHWVFGDAPYEEWRAAALAAGATPVDEPRPDPARRAAPLRPAGHGGGRGGLRPVRPRPPRPSSGGWRRRAGCAPCGCSPAGSGSSA